jgi:hypothetical protein
VWSCQLLIALPLAILGCWRLVYGPPLGRLMWPAWIAAVLWLTLVAAVLASSRGRRWLTIRRHHLTLTAIATVLALAVVGETVIRLVGESDEDGNFYLRGHHVRPYYLPVKRIARAVEAYLATPTTFLIADPALGWAPRPEVKTPLYVYNRQGIRVQSPERIYTENPPEGTLRLALFGDSFTNGAEVMASETWGAFAEAALRGAHGGPVEVLNFGVNGYGVDQAFLRWQNTGAKYSPAIVVLGLQVENLKRNLNLVRPLYTRTTENLPFSKPRFVLEGGTLRVVNAPSVPPESLVARVEHIADWPLREYEAYYNPEDYRRSLLSNSRLIGFVLQIATDTVEGKLDDDECSEEEQELGLRILEEFEVSARAVGARFLVLHLPRRPELTALAKNGTVSNRAFLERVRQRFDFLTAADGLVDEMRRVPSAGLFQPGNHYSPRANRIVGDILAQGVQSRLTNSARALR